MQKFWSLSREVQYHYPLEKEFWRSAWKVPVTHPVPPPPNKLCTNYETSCSPSQMSIYLDQFPFTENGKEIVTGCDATYFLLFATVATRNDSLVN
jgi:hypothetical protein